jgi:NAD(P)-dependent dehydrogenase (short-subunit alcohol dehydrogenase family)
MGHLMSSKSLKGKVCLITGSTNGIGKITAMDMAMMGCTVVLVARDKGKAKATKDEIISKTKNRSVEVLMADLSSLKEIRKLAEDFKKKHDKLHILINNAATVPKKRKVSVDGYEMQFATNHLAYFLLTHLLLDVIKTSSPARIINTSSGLHVRGKIDFNDLQSEKDYKGFSVYPNTKLANILFTYELARRLNGSGVTVNTWTPGMSKTGLGREFGVFSRFMLKLIGKPAKKGARTLTYLATSPKVECITGKYFMDLEEKRSSKSSYDKNLQARLWKVSEELTRSTD